ncbi:hypothetical protein [Amycolatopsis samaneae]|uniref:Uncharacterized protein n=1 Tax=Amycolatopsis samaneae TaxID=664691 RepID=A0ABW5GDI6_9PSEU
MDRWLERHDWFEGGHLALAERAPDGTVTLELEYYRTFRPEPGEYSAVETHRLTARPAELAMAAPAVSGHGLEEVESGTTGDGRLFVELYAPGTIRVEAAEFTAERIAVERRRTAAEPFFAEFRVELAVPVPAASWSARVSELFGETVVWRVLGSPTGDPAPADPDGRFLQELSCLDSTDHGALCLAWSGGTALVFRHYQVDDALWSAVRRAAATFATRIRCGNCVFTPDGWAEYLATGVIRLAA